MSNSDMSVNDVDLSLYKSDYDIITFFFSCFLYSIYKCKTIETH